MARAKNYAFIDSQNLHLGIRKLGWKLDYRKFRVYLAEKYDVQKAYIFIGFIPSNQALYERLENAGFILKFKPTVQDHDGKIKGNVDSDLVLCSTVEMPNYDRAVIVSSDGDFYSLVQYLFDEEKLECVLSPDIKNCSVLLRKAAKSRMYFMDTLRDKLEYKRKTPPGDKTHGSAFQ